jgi:hypothetical protein
MGYSSTLDYLCEAARQVYQETGLLPHLNPGNMTAGEIEMLRPLAISINAPLSVVCANSSASLRSGNARERPAPRNAVSKPFILL